MESSGSFLDDVVGAVVEDDHELEDLVVECRDALLVGLLVFLVGDFVELVDDLVRDVVKQLVERLFGHDFVGDEDEGVELLAVLPPEELDLVVGSLDVLVVVRALFAQRLLGLGVDGRHVVLVQVDLHDRGVVLESVEGLDQEQVHFQIN